MAEKTPNANIIKGDVLRKPHLYNAAKGRVLFMPIFPVRLIKWQAWEAADAFSCI
ncbi:hypothetical protein [Niabella hirudinis]|uniref:hypothetical protein n=1 Tax=Niabella hirudinis TaxID=1285929 RepID=UPI003EBE31C1